MSKTKNQEHKLTSEELTGVQELQTKLNQVLANIGNAEIVKNQMITSHAEIQVEWTTLTSKLEEKYGTVNISLEDGTISEVEATPVSNEQVMEKV
jgi:regulator of replication initiation timing